MLEEEEEEGGRGEGGKMGQREEKQDDEPEKESMRGWDSFVNFLFHQFSNSILSAMLALNPTADIDVE